MAPKKKKGVVRARKVRSHGLWIAPDLERTIKGEGGRRGLNDPPYGYYLQLADLALKPSEPLPGPPVASKETTSAEEPLPAVQAKPLKTTAGLKRSKQFRVAAPAKPPKVTLPKTRSPKPPKLAAPKPPRRRPPPKLSIPKPPKRRR